MQKIFGMISLGCDKNRVDGERILGEIKAHGCEITNDMQKVQVLIVNSCAFLNAARQEAIDAVLEGNSLRGGALEKIVISGCLPQKYIGELYPALEEADVFLGISDVSELFPALERAYRGERVNAVGKGKESFGTRVVSTPPHIKYLKIAEGCSNHCTYCLIPKIRGAYQSYPMGSILREAKSLGKTEELVLVAQDVTRYGEEGGKNQLVPLLEKLSELENIRHIRLLYCYPEKITEELLEEIGKNDKIIKYLDIPLQHSEDRILKLMGRKGSREAYLRLFENIRRKIPSIALRSTFITGFPSETEEEHRALKEFLCEVKFTNCGFFAYSREEDTPAYSFSAQVHPSTKKRRQRELYEVQAEISRENLKKFVGKELSVLCDGKEGEDFVGRASFQAYEIDGQVRFSAEKAESGKYYRVSIEGSDAYDLKGRSMGRDESAE